MDRVRIPKGYAAVLLAVSVLTGRPAHGQGNPILEEAKLLAADGASFDEFGSSVALDNGSVVVGAPRADVTASDDGAAYVFVLRGGSWIQQQKLLAGDGVPGDEFGRSVGMSGDTLVVGAPEHVANLTGGGSQIGVAYVFVRSGASWTEQAQLVPTMGGEKFGSAVAIAGDTIVVGALNDSEAGAESGSAHVFVRSGATWSQTAKLIASDAQPGDRFGVSVSIDGSTIVVGADERGATAVASPGSAYVFFGGGSSWSEQAKLIASYGQAGDAFGAAVSIDGDTVMVGATGRDEAGADAGAAYFFARTGNLWCERQTLLPGAMALVDFRFGSSVAVSGGAALIGAPGGHGRTLRTGATFGFVRIGESWHAESHLRSSDGLPRDFLGIAVALEGADAVVGARLDDAADVDRGSAYVFRVGRSPVQYCTGKPNSLGCEPFVLTCLCGHPSVSAPVPFEILVKDLIPGQVGFLMYGYAEDNLDFHGGKLCVRSPRPVFPAGLAQPTGQPPCTGVLQHDFNRRIQNGGDPMLTVGQPVFAQWRQRDRGDPAGYGDSLSNAVRFVVQP